MTGPGLTPINWSIGAVYGPGTLVMYEGRHYVSLKHHVSSLSSLPGQDGQNWILVNNSATATSEPKPRGTIADRISWVMVSGNAIPYNAIQGGYEADGEPLFIARANYAGGKHIGKASRMMWDGARIPYGRKEVIVRDYEILVGDPTAIRWHRQHRFLMIESEQLLAIEGGYDADGTKFYVAKSNIKGGEHIGKCNKVNKGAWIPYGGREHICEMFEVLILNE